METKELIKTEQSLLRAELQELKRCQLQYFTTSVAGTGIIFGLLDKLGNGNEMFFLAPLMILLPCWWTFFDKATTITRLVGYSVYLEQQITAKFPKYVGYGNALKEFRRREDERKTLLTRHRRDRRWKSFASHPVKFVRHRLRCSWRALWNTLKLVTLRTRHRYWVINWYTYFGLALVCCSIPILKFRIYPLPFRIEKTPLWAALGMTILSSIYTLNVVYHLTRGRYSYERVSSFWLNKVLPKKRA